MRFRFHSLSNFCGWAFLAWLAAVILGLAPASGPLPIFLLIAWLIGRSRAFWVGVLLGLLSLD